MRTKRTAFYTFMSDNFFYNQRGFMCINSFKKFHPDIDLVVYREDMLEKAFLRKDGFVIDNVSGAKRLAWWNVLNYFAKLMFKKYDRILHLDGDVITTGRLDSVLKDDWDIGVSMNFNKYENTFIEDITEKMYVHNSICGSNNLLFWNEWHKLNKNASKYKFYDCDTLNLLFYKNKKIKKMRKKIFDKEKDYYGCKSLGRENEMYIENNELMLAGEKVKAYHWGKGNVLKFRFETLAFTPEVIKWLYNIGTYGQSIIVKGI